MSNTWREEMLTKLILDMMIQKNMTEEKFFQNAYFYKYGNDIDVTNHVAHFRLHADVPSWVIDYAKTLKTLRK